MSRDKSSLFDRLKIFSVNTGQRVPFEFKSKRQYELPLAAEFQTELLANLFAILPRGTSPEEVLHLFWKLWTKN